MKMITIVMVVLGLTGSVLAQPKLGDESVTFEDFSASSDDGGVQKSPDWSVWSLSGIGIASLAVGISLYAVGQADEASLEGAERDSEGRIRSVTQRRAFRLETEAADRMGTGTGFMIAGVILGGAAALWYIYGQQSEVLPAKPRQNQIVPFGAMPHFELNVRQDVWKLSGTVLF
jgi:hypothetical protein